MRRRSATCDFYIDHAAAADGVPYWDTGAPGLAVARRLGIDALPIRSTITSRSTARPRRSPRKGCCGWRAWPPLAAPTATRYEQAGLRVLETLIDETGPYLSRDATHQGLLLHSIYHRPNGWDYVPAGLAHPARRVEHVGRLPSARGGALVKRMAEGEPYYTFFGS